MAFHHGGRAVSRSRAFGVALVVALAMAGLAMPAAPASADESEPLTYRPVTVVQANLSKDLGAAKFEADLGKVFAEQPDVITYNEVHRREDAQLAPAGYAMFRTPGPRTGWAPVAWRTDIWTALDQGTWKISDRPKKFQNKPGMVGVRFANWVTLTSDAGEVISVISAHIAPNNNDTAELLVPSLRRLRQLAIDLGQYGPVILGGDFNMGLRGDRYQPQYLAQAGLTNTFELTGTSFVTHRRGGTIDYVFLGPDGRFTVDDHYPVVLNSDHRMVVAHLQLASDPVEELPRFTPGKVVSNARGSRAERLAIRSLQLRAIQAAQPGAAIHIASPRIRGGALLAALADAKERGADVTIITGNRPLSREEKRLRWRLGSDSTASSYFVKAGHAWRSPKGARGATGNLLRPTVLLISKAGATRAFTLWADCDLGLTSLIPRFGRVSTANVATRLKTYDRTYSRYLAVVGRSY